MTLRLTNSLTRKKEEFIPLIPANVRMYVCGPTVYDFAHIGNARPVIVFDVMFRLLRHIYGEDHVKYVRNITDVDDKIIERALSEGRPIDELTRETADQYEADVHALGCLPPSATPRATGHIPQMISIILKLIEKGFAYEAEGHVLFDVPKWEAYGELSGRSTDEMIAGARVEVAPYKRSPMDFILWKPSTDEQPGWDSPWGEGSGRGRPGWHIECSAMAKKHLGEVFDIHGGGIDLAFPHHENEIAQSRCAHGTKLMAKYWMHNGFLQVEGEKMSKSLGNFITIRDLLKSSGFGGSAWHGYVLRLAMLMTHYRQPIDWTADRLGEARNTLRDWTEIAIGVNGSGFDAHPDVLAALQDDLNTPLALSVLHGLATAARKGEQNAAEDLNGSLRFLGLWNGEPSYDIYNYGVDESDGPSDEDISALVEARIAARAAKDFAEADRLRDELVALGIVLKDGPDGTVWERSR